MEGDKRRLRLDESENLRRSPSEKRSNAIENRGGRGGGGGGDGGGGGGGGRGRSGEDILNPGAVVIHRSKLRSNGKKMGEIKRILIWLSSSLLLSRDERGNWQKCC